MLLLRVLKSIYNTVDAGKIWSYVITSILDLFLYYVSVSIKDGG